MTDSDAENAYRQWRAQFLLARGELDDSTLWQGPGLALAAQAFLISIALGTNEPRFARVVASLLALVATGAAAYLILRKRLQGHIATSELNEIVRDLYHQHELQDLGSRAGRAGQSVPRWLRFETTTVWFCALVAFGVADAVIAILAIFGCPWLGAY
jgi:hypothetical protein